MPWHSTTLPPDASDDGRPWPVEVAGTDMVLAWVEGRWYAVEDRCSHAGCAFSEDGTIDGPHLICDCHGSEFDIRTGAVVRPPAIDPIATFPARMGVNDRLEVEL